MNDQKSSPGLYGLTTTLLITVSMVVNFVAASAGLYDRFGPVFIVLLVLNGLGLAAAALAARAWWHSKRGSGILLGSALGPKRDAVQAEVEAQWRNAKIDECREIDLMALSLRNSFFQFKSPFSRWLLQSLRSNHDLRVRILLMDPGAEELLAYREMAERMKKGGHLRESCLESLETLNDLCCQIWREQGQRRPQVRLVTEVLIQQWLFRIDGEMIVSPYLQHRTGRNGPVFRLSKGRPWFDEYLDQFEDCLRLHEHNLFPSTEALQTSTGGASDGTPVEEGNA